MTARAGAAERAARLAGLIRRAAARMPARLSSFPKLMSTGWRALLQRVGSWPHWARHFALNLVIGVGIELLLHLMSGGALVTSARNFVLDSAMAAAANLVPRAVDAGRRARPPITIFDIDDAAWQSPEWGGGEPVIAPRPDLARLIEIAAGHGARFVVVDIIIDAPASPADEAFAARMAALVPRLAPDQRILFVRTVRRPVCLGEAVVGASRASALSAPPCAPGEPAPTLRPSPLDALTAASRGALVSVAPNFYTSFDDVLRRWRLWQAVCVPRAGQPATADRPGVGNWRMLPSIQLAIDELRRGADGPPPWDARSFGRCRPALIGANGGEAAPPGTIDEPAADAAMRALVFAQGQPPHPEHGAEHGEEAARDDPGSRILFRFNNGTTAMANGDNAVFIADVPTLLRGRDPGDLNGQVVIIGQSNANARDLHFTPLGMMSGPMVIANAIASLDHPGVIAEASEWLEISVALTMIVLVALVFAIVPASLSLVLAIAFVPIIMALSLMAINSGYYIGFEIALLGIYIHWLYGTIEASLRSKTEFKQHR